MNNMNVHKNAYSGGIEKRIGRSDLKESGASRAKAHATLKHFGMQAWLSAQEGKEPNDFMPLLVKLYAISGPLWRILSNFRQ